jgi:replicative DNA helicase
MARETTTETTALRERVPPQDLDAEMALLGSMMVRRDAVADVVPIIGRQDSGWFYRPDHRRIFEVLLDLFDDPAKAIDIIVVRDEMRRREIFEEIGGEQYLIELAESYADWANAEYYARIVRDKGLLRDLIRCSGQITELAYDVAAEARDVLDRAEQKLFAVTEQRVGGRTVELRAALARLAQQLRPGEAPVCTGLPTGVNRLNELTGGFQPGDLIIIAARPAMGKTALGLNLAHHVACIEGHPVLFCSMEMSADLLAQRVVCARAGIDLQKVRSRFLSEEDVHKLLAACAELEDAPLYIDDTAGMTAMEVRSAARRMKQRHGVEAVFVDYLQLIHWPGAESRQVEIASISRSLKSLARELEIPVIAMAQLNRMPEGRADKRPMLSDLRESGAIEQDADLVMLIHREEYYRPEDESVRGQADLIIAKQRNGPTDTVELTFNRKLTQFSQRYVGPEHAAPRHGDDVPF